MKFRIFLFVLLLISADSSAQLNNLWRVSADVMPFNNKRSYEMPNGNILLVRMDLYNGNGVGDDLLLCYNPGGDLLWTYGDMTDQNLTSSNYVDIDFDSNNNIYLSGTFFPINALYPKTEVTKLSSNGELQWVSDFTQQSDWSENAFQIEVTQEDRIFLLVRLYNESAGSIIPYFAEINGNGDVVTLISDTEYQIGYSELMDFDDGFLYAVEADFITKLDYDGDVVWSVDLEFGEQFYAGFANENAEHLVQYKDGKIYVSLGLTDVNTNALYLGLAVVSTSGSLEQVGAYSILPDMTGFFYTSPFYLEIDSDNNLYATGMLMYGDGGIVGSAEQESGASRNRQGGNSFSGTFVVKFNSLQEQQWVSTFIDNETDGTHYPWGAFLSNDRMTVVFNKNLLQSNLQKIVQYDSATGDISWEHIETNTEEFQNSVVNSSLFSSTGDLYTCGSGYGVIDQPNAGGIYLYKYALDGVSITERIDNSTIRVYPNPASDQINISGIEAGSYLRVYNTVGQLCYNERLSSSQIMMDVQSWSAGMYQINIVGASIETLTLVKK